MIRYLLLLLCLIVYGSVSGQTPKLVLQKLHTEPIRFVMFNDNDQQIISFSDKERLIRIWQTRDERLITEIPLNCNSTPVVIPLSSRECIVNFLDDEIELVSFSGKSVKSIPYDQGSIYSIDIRTGTIVITNNNSSYIKLLDPSNGITKQINQPSHFTSVCNRAGRMIVQNKNDVIWYDLKAFLALDSIPSHLGGSFAFGRALSISNDGTLISVYNSNYIYIISTLSKDTLFRLPIENLSLSFSEACFSPSNHHFVTSDYDTIHLFDINKTPHLNKKIPLSQGVRGLRFLTDSLLELQFIGFTGIYNVKTNKWIHSFNAFDGDLAYLYKSVKYDLDGNFLYSYYKDTIYAKDVNTGTICAKAKVPTQYEDIHSVQLSNNKKYLITSGTTRNNSMQKGIYIYSIPNFHLLKSIPSGYESDEYRGTDFVNFVNNDTLALSGYKVGVKYFSLKNAKVTVLEKGSRILGMGKDVLLLTQDVQVNSDTVPIVHKNISLVDNHTGENLKKYQKRFPDPQEFLHAASIQSKEERAIIGTDAYVYEWDLKLNTLKKVLNSFSDYFVDNLGEYTIVTSPLMVNSGLIFSNRVSLGRQKPFQVEGEFFKPIPGTSLLFSAMTDYDKEKVIFKIYDLDGKKILDQMHLSDFTTNINSVDVSSKNKILAIGSLAGIHILKISHKNALVPVYTDTSHFFSVRSVKFSNDSRYLYFGTEKKDVIKVHLDNFERDTLPHEFSGVPLQLTLNRQDEKIVVAQQGNIVDIFDLKANKPYCMFINVNESDWEIMLPDGYYYLSGKSPRNINFTIWPKSYPFDQFDLKYNRPDKVLSALGSPDTLMIRIFKRAYEKRLKRLGFIEADIDGPTTLPEVEIRNQDQFLTETREKMIEIRFKAFDKNSFLRRYDILVNNVPVFGVNGKSIKDLKTRNLDERVNITLSNGRNKIQVSCMNENGAESLKETLYITYNSK